MRDHIVKQIEGVESSFKIHELREYLQRYSLAALYETGGFDSVAFVGGTCLRLYHGTQRYSPAPGARAETGMICFGILEAE